MESSTLSILLFSTTIFITWYKITASRQTTTNVPATAAAVTTRFNFSCVILNAPLFSLSFSCFFVFLVPFWLYYSTVSTKKQLLNGYFSNIISIPKRFRDTYIPENSETQTARKQKYSCPQTLKKRNVERCREGRRKKFSQNIENFIDDAARHARENADEKNKDLIRRVHSPPPSFEQLRAEILPAVTNAGNIARRSKCPARLGKARNL